MCAEQAFCFSQAVWCQNELSLGGDWCQNELSLGGVVIVQGKHWWLPNKMTGIFGQDYSWDKMLFASEVRMHRSDLQLKGITVENHQAKQLGPHTHIHDNVIANILHNNASWKVLNATRNKNCYINIHYLYMMYPTVKVMTCQKMIG